jgi:hypothetical protein
MISSCSSPSVEENPEGSGFIHSDLSYPDNKTTIFFHKNTVKIKYWNGYPLSDYAILKSEEEFSYTYDSGTKSGSINGNPFKLYWNNTNKPSLFLEYNGDRYIHEKVFSK